ncbi:MAG: aminotransferase class III-fold pyridoxal phosphate-dependent enzyme [Chthoniobacterales bacterium]
MPDDHPPPDPFVSKDRFQGTGQRLYRHAKTRIPGGTQLLSKRPEMFLPELWPTYYQRATGAEVWDLDGNRFFDFTHNGVGSCLLGYADPDVNAAVKAVIDTGSMATLNGPEEVELADLLCELHPWAEMVRYARTGGEAMAIAVRLARAATGRDKIAFCGYHGWSDWYLAANLAEGSALNGHLLPGLSPGGVPRGLQGTALPFRYNDLAGLKRIMADHGDKIAAIAMEPIRSDPPEPGFLNGVRALANEHGVLLIIDEITAGFRLNAGGAHLVLGVVPDLAVFAKGISNGYPMAAIMGTAKYMNTAQETFVSSTYWTERVGPAAALATIKKHLRLGLAPLLAERGERVREIWSRAAADAEIEIRISGVPPLPSFTFVHPEPGVLRTFFTQQMLERGYLAGPAVYMTYAHTDDLLDNYASAVTAVFLEIASLAKNGSESLERYLKGPVAHSGFTRLT